MDRRSQCQEAERAAMMSYSGGMPSPTLAASVSDLRYVNTNCSVTTVTALAAMTSVTNSTLNDTGPVVLPREMTFTEESLMSVVVYTVLFSIAALGNLTVFITLFRNRHRRSRVNLFIMHLSIADLIVTLVMMPLEIVWHLTVSWNAGDAACRILMFFRAFGFYLSSFILVAISLDRYFAIAHPLSLTDADRRGKLMLFMAWLFSFTASIPQSVIFHVEYHPDHTWFPQCVTFNFFPTPRHEMAYNLFNIMAVYVVPLLVIIGAYSKILYVISTKTKESREQTYCETEGDKRRSCRNDFRRSGIGRIEKARSRTLKMTIVIVFVFIICWTPYFTMAAWWWFKQESADRIHPKVQKGLFLFAVSNSCMNPIVYGIFAVNFTREFERCCNPFKMAQRKKRQSTTRTTLLQRSTNTTTSTTAAKQRGTATCVTKVPKTTCTPVQHTQPGGAPANHGGAHDSNSALVNKSVELPPPDAATVPLMSECNKVKAARTLTPPHIAHGKGLKVSFDQYLMI